MEVNYTGRVVKGSKLHGDGSKGMQITRGG